MKTDDRTQETKPNNLFIRDFDLEVHRRLKIIAAIENKALKDLIQAVLTDYVKTWEIDNEGIGNHWDSLELTKSILF